MLEWRDERAGIGSRPTVIGKDGENSGMSLRGGLIMRFRHYSDRARILTARLLLAAIVVLGRSTLLVLRFAFAADNETTGFHFLAADPSLRANCGTPTSFRAKPRSWAKCCNWTSRGKPPS